MICQNCKNESHSINSHCTACGTKFNRPKKVTFQPFYIFLSTLDMDKFPASREEALHLYVGEKYEYYYNKWGLEEWGKSVSPSINIGAIFGSLGWASGRCMYMFSFQLVFIYMVLDILFILIGIPFWHSALISFLPLIMYGFFGNKVYYNHAIKQAEKLMLAGKSRKEIVAAGGFKWNRFIIGLGFYCSYIILSILIFYLLKE